MNSFRYRLKVSASMFFAKSRLTARDAAQVNKVNYVFPNSPLAILYSKDPAKSTPAFPKALDGAVRNVSNIMIPGFYKGLS